MVWRDGTGSGWTLWRKGKPAADWSWNAPWRLVESDPLGLEVHTVRCLVKALGHPVEESSLRSLLRSKRPDRDQLAELVALLGLPMDLLVFLDNPERLREVSGVEHITRTSLRKAVFQGARDGFDADASPRWRVLSMAYAIGIGVAAGVCLAMTAFSVVVLVTHGAVIEQAGTSRQDWLRLALFAVLSLSLIPDVVFCMRRVKRWRRT